MEELDIPMMEIESLLMKGSKSVPAIITFTFREHQLPDSDFYDLFYFGCLFIQTLISHLPPDLQAKYIKQAPELLNDAAVEGLSFYKAIASSNLHHSDNRDEAVQVLADKLGKEAVTNPNLLLAVSEDIEKVAMKEGGLWKRREINLNEVKIKQLESILTGRFNDLIHYSLEELTSRVKVEHLELHFLAISVMNIGLIAGYGAGLFHQSIEEFMQVAVDRFFSEEGCKSTCLH